MNKCERLLNTYLKLFISVHHHNSKCCMQLHKSEYIMYTQSVLRYLLYLITALLGELRREARSLCKMCMRARINFTAAPFLFFPFPAEGGRVRL